MNGIWCLAVSTMSFSFDLYNSQVSAVVFQHGSMHHHVLARAIINAANAACFCSDS